MRASIILSYQLFPPRSPRGTHAFAGFASSGKQQECRAWSRNPPEAKQRKRGEGRLREVQIILSYRLPQKSNKTNNHGHLFTNCVYLPIVWSPLVCGDLDCPLLQIGMRSCHLRP